MSSQSHVRVALEQIASLQQTANDTEKLIAEKCRKESKLLSDTLDKLDKLKAAVDAYVLDGHDYEDDGMKITRVQGHRRQWKADVLEKIIPRGIFKNVVEYKVLPDKIEQYVREGKLDEKKIAKAFSETPNAPYSKWTKKKADKGAKGQGEAASLADKLA